MTYKVVAQFFSFRNKKKEYLKAKINELETNSKNKNIRDLYKGINEFNPLKTKHICFI
jgi:Txe/YoeB family toxin of Txe-Axe toxin-antitoxin module